MKLVNNQYLGVAVLLLLCLLCRDEYVAQMQKLEGELSEQNNKLRRAENELKQAQKALKRKELSASCLELIERDLDLKELENNNYSVLHRLSSIIDNDYELGPKLYRSITDRGIKLPHLIPRTRSSVSWRSDTSSETASSPANGKALLLLSSPSLLM